MRFLLTFVRLRFVKGVIVHGVIPILDVVLTPLTFAAALLMKTMRRVGVYRLPATKAVFNATGVFPIRDHYYEPMFNPRHLRRPLNEERSLPEIDLNEAGQLEMLAKFDYAAELERIPRRGMEGSYYYDNPNFSAGDAEFLYSVIRHFAPARILEIGSGFSTLMMLRAIEAKRRELPEYRCHVLCVEPYEMEWLDRLQGVKVLRQRAETLDPSHVRDLRENDILFIDSSHVIRPQGDVVYEYLELLPLLAPGVLIHIHDIFTPRDYPKRWIVDEVRLYNEQYLLEALLANNRRFRVIGLLNMLAHRHHAKLAEKFPIFRSQPDCEPSSAWLRRQ